MVAAALEPIRRLTRADDRSSFVSGAAELDDWFQRFAWENHAANNAISYVAPLGGHIAGYYSIASAAVSRALVPPSFGARRPEDVPAILLARFAVHQQLHGKGIGAFLLQDVVARAVELSESVGAACLLIHARDELAKQFYLRNLDLLRSPVEELHLIMPMKAARRHLKR